MLSVPTGKTDDVTYTLCLHLQIQNISGLTEIVQQESCHEVSSALHFLRQNVNFSRPPPREKVTTLESFKGSEIEGQ